MTTLTDLLLEREKENRIYFKNFKKYSRKIKEEARKNLGKVKVFIFGSILKKEEPKRDIDILLISQKLADQYEKTKMQVRIWRKIGIFSPFECHFATPEEYQNWYKYFLKEKIEV